MNYEEMTTDQLIQACQEKDAMIDKCLTTIKEATPKLLNKEDIMRRFHCENNKALRILRLLWQMGYGTKIGKEYYVEAEALDRFMDDMAGREVAI